MARNSRKRILIVDDDAESLSELRQILAKEKFEVLEAICPDEALDLLATRRADLVISGLKLAGMSGLEFLDELRQGSSRVPVILTGGGAKQKDWLRALRSDASAFLEKPFLPESVLEAVQKALAQSQSCAA